MGEGTLTIYNASAGSGKTYTLTGIYLKNLFRSRYNYRKMLAVTFTNKATAEMKSRILEHLHRLSAGENSDYMSALMKSTGKSEIWIRNEAGEILNCILHDFSRFSVSTIDSFFQKILRAFTREAGLQSGFNIELDHSAILSAAVDEMIKSSMEDQQLKDWLTSYVLSNIDEEKSWNLKAAVINLAEELFKEKFKILSANDRSNLENKKFLLGYVEKIKAIPATVEKQLSEFGKKAEEIFTGTALTDDMFYRKGQGVPRHIRMLAAGIMAEPNSYVREIMNDPPRWSTGKLSSQLQEAIDGGLERVMKEAIIYYDNNKVEYYSAVAVLSNIYALGILSDVLRNVHIITNNDNSFLLSETGELLNLIIGNDQTPFIYEKTGTGYENYMIDEFQDTSIIQWKNFSPLLENSMAGGFDNLVVGDIKQSIYRWRNSDWRILGSVLNSKVDDKRFLSESLTTNWRSHKNIIRFNNTLFSIIPDMLDESLLNETPPFSFRTLYSESVQSDPGKKSGGYVRLEFLENDKERRWQDSVLEMLPGVIESIQDKGYSASDIGIIVRDAKEGSQVLKTLIDYDSTLQKEKKQFYNFNVVSNDSLLLSNSPAICFILSLLNVVIDPKDMISRAVMLRFYLLSTGNPYADQAPLVSDNLISGSRTYFPEGYELFLETIKDKPLFEVIENIILFFGLGEYSRNVAYLNTFQDLILGFAGNKNSDIQSFLDWWEMTGKKKSVVLPVNQEAIRILTIHKSKGLEFRVVILPFLSWNLDHISSKQPFLWVKPTVVPFNELGILPVKYRKELLHTIFADNYKEEKYSVYLDNVNLLYVALTRAKDAIYGYSVDNPRSEATIAGLIKNAITYSAGVQFDTGFKLNEFYDTGKKIFEFGEIPENKKDKSHNISILISKYPVSQVLKSLRLRMHGENYFATDGIVAMKRINYGKIMHEIFESIKTSSDIPGAIRRLVLEGKLTDEESVNIENRIISIISTPQVADWFQPGNEILTETAILLPSGFTKRPDRVIIKEGNTTVIDFKFGKESNKHIEQVAQYSSLLAGMGYINIKAFIWYVDKNKIVSA